MKALLAALTTFIFIVSFAQKKAQKKYDATAKFDSYILASMPLWKVPGLSVAVVKDGKVLLQKGYGVTELGKAEP